ncbi:MAG: Lrp/AsnC family transcriptional regulator, partial [Candidatus Hodarchaeota archaeon]
RELLKNSKRSDRDLAKILKVSQPTITRARHRLEKNGMIKDYTIIPDFKKMGFEILALTFIKTRAAALTPETMKESIKYSAEQHNGIFASTGEGLGMTAVIITFHKNYTDYHRQLNQLRVDWKELVEDIQTFVVSIGEGEFKRFSLTYLKDVPL